MSVSTNKYHIGRLRKDRIYVLDCIAEDKETYQEDRLAEWYDELRCINAEIVRLMAVVFT